MYIYIYTHTHTHTHTRTHVCIFLNSQVVLVVKNPPPSAGNIRDTGLIFGWGRSPGEGNGKPLEHSYLGNPMDREEPGGVQSMQV